MHEDFVDGELHDDIGYVILTVPLVSSLIGTVQPIKPFSADEQVEPDTFCITVGCLKMSSSTWSSIGSLPIVQARVSSKEKCENQKISELVGLGSRFGLGSFATSPSTGYFCANKTCDFLSLLGSCARDSGSPLICPDASGNLKVAGVRHSSANCFLRDIQSKSIDLYTDLSYYTDYITGRKK